MKLLISLTIHLIAHSFSYEFRALGQENSPYNPVQKTNQYDRYSVEERDERFSSVL